MTGSSITDNQGVGVEVIDASADLANGFFAGANTLQQNGAASLVVESQTMAVYVKAYGNTWTPLVQRADPNGSYDYKHALTPTNGPTGDPASGNYYLQNVSSSILF